MHMQPLFAAATDSSGLMADSKRRKIYPAGVIGKENLGIQEFKNSGIRKDKIKARVIGGEVAEDLFNRGLCLPSGTQMTEEGLDRVISVILSCKR